MPVKTGIQNMLKILDSPVSSTGQAQSRASLALNDKKVITTQSQGPDGEPDVSVKMNNYGVPGRPNIRQSFNVVSVSRRSWADNPEGVRPRFRRAVP